ncbi:MAG: Antitoxin HigA, partial [uncultured Rubrobacteraceae bacterium]
GRDGRAHPSSGPSGGGARARVAGAAGDEPQPVGEGPGRGSPESLRRSQRQAGSIRRHGAQARALVGDARLLLARLAGRLRPPDGRVEARRRDSRSGRAPCHRGL